jgi:outer membrane protein OmpA-like peptidoglycan-associated protein
MPTPEIKDNLPAVFFQFDSIEFRKDAEAGDSMVHFLDALAQIQEHFKKYGAKAHLTVHGFASPDGDDGHNQTLSQQRADRVKELLVAAGIPEGQITAVGHGVGNLFPSAPTLNRCVVFERTPEVIVQ